MRPRVVYSRGARVAMDDIAEVVDAQLDAHGVSAVTVSDGTVFTFTLATLEQLVKAAQATGRAIVFVQRAVLS